MTKPALPASPASPAVDSLYEGIRQLVERARAQVLTQVNQALVLTYWHIGKTIKTEVLQQERAQYGAGVLKQLAERLAREYGSGFSHSGLTRMAKLYEQLPDLEMVATLSQQLSWSHFVELIKVDDGTKRAFYTDKPGGLVVDYLGIAADLKEALSFYSDAGGKGDPTLAQEQAVALMLEKIEVISALYHGFAYEHYFDADTAQKLSLILAAEEHLLGLNDGRKRYINEVTALSQAFAIAVPHAQAMDAKDEVGFFQAVKARLIKFDSTVEGRSNEEIETTIRQVIDQALVSEKVIDVFDAASIKKPDISILSDEFLAELKGYEHKNVALEVLKKLLSDELKLRAKRNLVQSRSLMEMLETAIKRYHNKILTAAEVMDELIKVSKEIVASDDEAKHLGLSDFEYAFYTAVAHNDSARQLMQQDQLRELAVVLTQRVRENASIDWTIKENVRAKLKVIVKRTLRQFGYPPDMQLLATETVLKQAEMIASELTNHVTAS